MTPESFVAALRTALPGVERAPLHEPFFEGRELDYLKECIDTRFVSSVGAFVERFERDLETLTGCGRAVAVVNGTAAVRTCLLLAGVGRDDEVLVPALTFVAAANAVAHQGAFPHLVESEWDGLGVCPRSLAAWLAETGERRDDGCWNRRTGRRIRALLVVHVLGHPADMDAIKAVCDRWGIILLEDASEAVGTLYKGEHAGRHGLASALSFNGNKIVTTGGGGAVLTEDVDLGAQAKHLTTTAKRPHAWEFVHDEVAFNFRMPNLNAAVGCAQLERLAEVLTVKARLARRYAEVFAEFDDAALIPEPSWARSNHWLNAVLLDDPALRDPCLQAALDAGFGCRPLWQPMHQLEIYRDHPRAPDLSVAEQLVERVICLPSSENLGRLDA